MSPGEWIVVHGRERGMLCALRMIDGKKVNPQDYRDCLKELMNVCMLCNDSGLTFNEVCKT